MQKNFETAAWQFKTKKVYLALFLSLFLLTGLNSVAQIQTNRAPNDPIRTPTNTVGNTPSSVRTGGIRSSGYSGGGNTANTNINNTQTGQRSNGQPIGSGSKTTAPYGNK